MTNAHRAAEADDVDAMEGAVWDDPRVVRVGIAEVQVGVDAIRTWRRGAVPVPTTRRLTSRHVLALADDVVTVDITFVNGDAPAAGHKCGRGGPRAGASCAPPPPMRRERRTPSRRTCSR